MFDTSFRQSALVVVNQWVHAVLTVDARQATVYLDGARSAPLDSWSDVDTGAVAVEGEDAVTPRIETVASDGVSGFTTARLWVTLPATARNVYSMYGTPEAPLTMPAAWQAVAPFGVDIGGVNPQLLAFDPSAAYDSWLTVGVTEGVGRTGLRSTPNLFQSWDPSTPISSTNGAYIAEGKSRNMLHCGIRPGHLAQPLWPTAPRRHRSWLQPARTVGRWGGLGGTQRDVRHRPGFFGGA